MFNLKISYLIVFLSLIFWATFAFFTMNEQITNQKIYAKLINISGKQRMLSQKTTLMAKRVYESNSKELINHSHTLVALMKKDHQYMLNNLTSTIMKDIYFKKPYDLDTQVQGYFKLLDMFHKKKELETLQKIEEYSFSLLGKLNYAVNEFEKESDRHTEALKNRELFIFIGTLITLFIEAILIIIPTIRKIGETKKHMTKFNDKLKKKVEEQKQIILKDEEDKKEREKIIQQKERQASMGEMIRNIAHQWRQPLSIISTSATGMKMKKEYAALEDEEFYKLCDSINDNAQYLSKTILNVSGSINNINVKYNLNDEITNIKYLFDESFKFENINIELNLNDDIEVFGYKNELTQSLINILNNSKDALMSNDIEKKYIYISTCISDKLIEIKVLDNGGGIKEENLSKIFDPYFSTKYKSQDVGQGLNSAYNLIVNNMNGDIKVKNCEYMYKNKKYIGVEFVIFLPNS